MRFTAALCVLGLLANSTFAQNAANPAAQPEPKSVTVPAALDHNRVLVDVDLPLPDGSTERVRGWIDPGDPELRISQRAAKLMGLNITCSPTACSAPPPREITIGGMKISLASVKEAQIPLRPDNTAGIMAPGMSAEIKVPSSVLRNYDVLINFPDHEFAIGLPGSLKFKGVSAKVAVNSENALVQINSKIDNKNYNLVLAPGSPISFLAEELFDKLAGAHSDWPHMTGAIGPANIWGGSDETKWKLLRVDRIQYGPLYLTEVAVAAWPNPWMTLFEKQTGISSAGLLGANALLNYRVGFDYAHKMVYFDIGTTFKAPDFDVVGLTLHPEDDGRFTVICVADFENKSSVPEVQPGDLLVAVDGIPAIGSTMGRVWSMLRGLPGQERKLTMERAGKQFTVAAKVQHFLGDAPDEKAPGKNDK